ncbi:hypothetical protein IWQ60_002613 [Tieghemiomyces parasiticus]|uniref:Ribosomal RNA-processing protein 42 n=1 Tax=Tieghemiomyces parasiticus TaxID=78921 RepID=A0A9W8DX81_9FUNG|nr:hypothetical protein IWQ60_002613 [Tieghemiomyces parasiticus]
MDAGFISHAEYTYIQDGLAAGIREDGRGPRDYRDYLLSLDVISHSSGSARCRIGFGTDILVGVKAEVNSIDPSEPSHQGRIQCNVECSPNASQNLAGRAIDDLNNELTRFLTRALNCYGGIDLGKLCIIPKQSCWVLYVDALVLDYDGNLYDALMMATVAALYNARIPQVEIEATGDDGEMDFDVIDDAEAALPVPGRERLPLAITLNWAKGAYIADASMTEEYCVDSRLTVLVNPQGKICAVQKSALGTIPESVMPELLTSATQIAAEMHKDLTKRIETEVKTLESTKHQGHVSTFLSNTFL